MANRKSYIEFVSVWLRGTKVGRAGFGEEGGRGAKNAFFRISEEEGEWIIMLLFLFRI